VAALEEQRRPYNVSNVAQKTARAALGDRDHAARMRTHVRRWRPRIAEVLEALGASVPPSEGNFVMADFGTAARADEVLASLSTRGILVRGLSDYGLAPCLRITIGTDADNDAFVRALKESEDAHA
jgi:histidinol-phosphate aminotransferase